MAGAYHRLKTNYSFAVNEGFAVLSRMAGRTEEWPHPNTGNVNEEIMLDAIYGGSAKPDLPSEYTVYSVDWLDGLPGENEAAGPEDGEDIEPQTRRVSGVPAEEFRRHLDDHFKGWVYHHGSGEVFVMADDSDEDYPHQHDQ